MKKLNITLFILLLALPCQAATLVDLQKKAVANRKIVEQYKAKFEKSTGCKECCW